MPPEVTCYYAFSENHVHFPPDVVVWGGATVIHGAGQIARLGQDELLGCLPKVFWMTTARAFGRNIKQSLTVVLVPMGYSRVTDIWVIS